MKEILPVELNIPGIKRPGQTPEKEVSVLKVLKCLSKRQKKKIAFLALEFIPKS